MVHSVYSKDILVIPRDLIRDQVLGVYAILIPVLPGFSERQYNNLSYISLQLQGLCVRHSDVSSVLHPHTQVFKIHKSQNSQDKFN